VQLADLNLLAVDAGSLEDLVGALADAVGSYKLDEVGEELGFRTNTN